MILPTVDEILKVLAKPIFWQPRRITFDKFLLQKGQRFTMRIRITSSRKRYLVTSV